MLSGWQNFDSSHEMVDQWLESGHKDGGVGVLCSSTVACDIDCYDKAVNRKMWEWLRKNVGESGRRVGQPPKFVMPYRVSSPIKKEKKRRVSRRQWY